MEAGHPGKNHNGFDLEWKKRLNETKQRVRQAIATMQQEFKDVAQPAERRILKGSNDKTLTVTPEEILNESLGDIDAVRPTSEGTGYDVAFVAKRTGELWSATVIPETGSVTFQRIDKRNERITGVEYVRYVPQHEISQNSNGQEPKHSEPATVSIVVNSENGNQELVFRAPVTEPLPTSSHPS